jgi:TolB-like protein/tetratricopeptide (TPR) repeat protein
VALKNIITPVTVYRIVQTWDARRAGPRSTQAGRDLAVLPLANISPDPKDEYFADGLTEELITTLSQLQDLRVIARTSVIPYKSTPKSVPLVGAELGVDTILEGSVRKAGNRIRITLQLVDVGTQRHIWATSYDREIGDVFAVQTDIATRTAEALKLQLAGGPSGPGRRRPSVNPEAYDLYLRGLVAANDTGGAGLYENIRWFERATELDPTFAEAYAAWSNQYVIAAGEYVSVREVMPRARELAAHALELDPESSEAHSVLGNIALQFDHDWKRAESEFQRAIELNPSNVNAYRFYGMLLMALERFSEARDIYREVTRLDPAGRIRGSLAWAELESGNYARAIEFAEEDCRKHPSSVAAHVAAGLTYLTAGRKSDAIREAGSPLTDASPVERFDHALLNALVGRPDEGKTILETAERGSYPVYLSPADFAMMYGALGDHSKALDFLEKDYREGDRILWLTYRGLFFDSVRDDPRFVALLKAYGLPTHGLTRVPPK